MQAFAKKPRIYVAVPKHRKPKFDLRLKIIDLNNIPLISGTAYVKWSFPPHTSSPEHHGRTPKTPILREHKAVWDYTKKTTVRLTIDRHGMLQEMEVCFEVVQEYAPSSSSGGSSAVLAAAAAAATAGGGGKGEANMLGFVRLNLAEYVEVGNADSGEGGNGEVVRRYLMQGSKINSTLKIGILMAQIEGETNFIAPPLRSAPVFGGLTSLSLASADDSHPTSSHIPLATSVPPPTSSKTGITARNETIKVQDMYRQTLAASWAAQTGELRADEVIEDIFGGGSGWRAGGRRMGRGNEEESEGEGDRRTLRGGEEGKEGVVSSSRSHSRVGNRAERVIDSHHEDNRFDAGDRGRYHEINELEAREDLRSWRIGSYV